MNEFREAQGAGLKNADRERLTRWKRSFDGHIHAVDPFKNCLRSKNVAISARWVKLFS